MITYLENIEKKEKKEKKMLKNKNQVLVNLIEARMDRNTYSSKINEYLKKEGLDYKYKKNDKDIYYKLCKYGSLDNAIKYAIRVHNNHCNDNPSDSESCTTVYKFFQEVKERLKELE